MLLLGLPSDVARRRQELRKEKRKKAKKARVQSLPDSN